MARPMMDGNDNTPALPQDKQQWTMTMGRGEEDDNWMTMTMDNIDHEEQQGKMTMTTATVGNNNNNNNNKEQQQQGGQQLDNRQHGTAMTMMMMMVMTAPSCFKCRRLFLLIFLFSEVLLLL